MSTVRAVDDGAGTHPLPSATAVARATAGFLVFGASAGLGSGTFGTAIEGGPSVLSVGVGTLLLTGPALVVVHQYLGLRSRPLDVVATLATGFVASGGLALGLAPFLLFFAATTPLWLPLVLTLGAGCGAVALAHTAAALLRLERPSPAVFGLVIGWAALSTAVAGRLAFAVAAGGAR